MLESLKFGARLPNIDGGDGLLETVSVQGRITQYTPQLH